MPYIKVERRDAIALSGFRGELKTSGDLNYAFTKMIEYYLKDKTKTYTTFNDVVGALESCKLEFYRRAVVPYENQKIKENGDVY